jgi:hypothetical protein
MLHAAIVARSYGTIHGTGLITTQAIPEGTLVWKLDEPTFTLEEIQAWPEARRMAFKHYGFQCGVNLHSLAEGLSREANHSCDPNTWWGSSETLVACRDICAGEEVTYDYATCDIDIDFTMQCRCGARNCRGEITNRDYLDPAWQLRYGNHLPAHVLSAIAVARRSGSGAAP